MNDIVASDDDQLNTSGLGWGQGVHTPHKLLAA